MFLPGLVRGGRQFGWFLVLAFLPFAAGQDPRDATGWTALSARLGPDMPTGAGITVMQVEAPLSGAYLPFAGMGSGEFLGKTNIDRTGGGGVSSHAVEVGRNWYGNESGYAPGITTIESYEAGNYLTSVLQAQLALSQPAQIARLNLGDVRIVNNSWISLDGTSFATRAIRRIDYQVDFYNVIYINAVNNGPGTAVPPIPGSAYNGITCAIESEDSSHGPATFDGLHQKPDIAAPSGFTSFAAPQVAGAAALLIEQGEEMGSPESQRPQVIKAIMMAAASKGVFWEPGNPGPADDVNNPLDFGQGAGVLRVDRNYDVMDAGPLAHGPQLQPRRGWSYDTITLGATRDYRLHIATSDTDLCGTLIWHRHHSTNFSMETMLALDRMSLELWSTDAAGEPLAMLKRSYSTDNAQLVRVTGLSPGVYLLRATNVVSSAVPNEPYGIAWWSDGDVLVGDMNGDGIVNNFDIEPFVLALTNPAAFSAQYPGVDPLVWGDVNGDDVLNNFDIDPFVNLLTGP